MQFSFSYECLETWPLDWKTSPGSGWPKAAWVLSSGLLSIFSWCTFLSPVVTRRRFFVSQKEPNPVEHPIARVNREGNYRLWLTVVSGHVGSSSRGKVPFQRTNSVGGGVHMWGRRYVGNPYFLLKFNHELKTVQKIVCISKALKWF